MPPKARKPIAVLAADIHYSIGTLTLADAATNAAIAKAEALKVPFVVAGDLHDTKANLRGECTNAMIKTFKAAKIPVYVLTGNHDKINEKSVEHSLEFLRPYVNLIDETQYIQALDAFLIPYQSSAEDMLFELEDIREGATIICHQGVHSANMGHYAQDKTSLPKEAFANFRTISGHYHMRQDIKCGRPRKGGVGLFSYIGNPYTLNFGEANDPPKGFQVLYDDGSLEFIPTNLREHVIIDRPYEYLYAPLRDKDVDPNNMIWLKLRGLRSELQTLNKADIGAKLFGHTNFKLDLIPEGDEPEKETQKADEQQTDFELFDSIIDGTGETDEQKAYLKALYREALE